jgi:hypothetical protein
MKKFSLFFHFASRQPSAHSIPHTPKPIPTLNEKKNIKNERKRVSVRVEKKHSNVLVLTKKNFFFCFATQTPLNIR